MRISVKKAAFAVELAAVSAIIKLKNAVPALTCVKLEAGTALAMVASDLDCFYVRVCACELFHPGTCLLPVRETKEWLDAVGDGDVVIAYDGKQVSLFMDGYDTLRLSAYNVEEFPKCPTPPQDESVLCAKANLSGLKHIAWSVMQPDGGRPPLEAVFIDKEEAGIIACSTDGRKLGTVKIKAEVSETFKPVAIPAKYINLVASLGEVDIMDCPRDLFFDGNLLRLTVRKTEHPIPDWRKVLTQYPYVGSAKVVRDEFAAAVRCCHLLRGRSTEFNDGVRITVSKAESGDGLKIECIMDKTADSYSNVIMARLEGDIPTINLGSDHVLPFFSLPDDSALKIEFTGDRTHCHMNAGDVSYWFLLLIPKQPKE
jgi:DNA polymerase III sliding clamp (beta) subunit (PCNA family)